MATDVLDLFDPLSEPQADSNSPPSSPKDRTSFVEITKFDVEQPAVPNGYPYSSEDDSEESLPATYQEEPITNGETTPSNPETAAVNGSRDGEEDGTAEEHLLPQQTPAADEQGVEPQTSKKKVPLAVQFNSLPRVFDRSAEADDKDEANATSDIIRSDRGSVYGWTNQVTKSKSAFLGKVAETKMSPRIKKVVEEEAPNEELGIKGKIVIYITSLSAVRETYSKSCAVLEVFHNHRVRYKTKDTYLHPKYKKELKERLNERKVTIPQVFINGQYVGDDKKILEMNESGQLLSRIIGFEKTEADEVCPTCNDRGFIMCMWCKGSKKGWKNRFGSLECTVCNKNALQKCPDCSDLFRKVKKSATASEQKQE